MVEVHLSEQPKDQTQQTVLLRKILYWTQFIAGILVIATAILWFRQ